MQLLQNFQLSLCRSPYFFWSLEREVRKVGEKN